MCPPSPCRLRTAVLATATTLLTVPAVVLAQRTPSGYETGTETATAMPWYVQAIIAGGLTLVIGGLLVAVAPDSTRRRTDRALEAPGITFVYGVVSGVVVIGAAFLLAITGFGLIFAVPMLLIFVLVALVSGEYGYLAVGRLVSDDWLLALGSAIVVSAAVGAVPVLGTIVGFVISSIGLGTAVMAFQADRDSRP
ncbi:hypothetical protein HYG81_07520 [Natrinema zhouii]|uniref:DUF8173 domain-containing protein n=1 Tax=Natrinema zhouii TaxID=1710539 RepID=A0A7D6CQK9_9EURY|nr:hypothetical protein [Natrinema zhouii]QLK27438.1 hypothetical protein HYG81_07520 [Natrinema zhouii]